MTAVDDRPVERGTATSPTLRSSARTARGPVLVVVALVVSAVVLGVLSATGPGGRLDPDSYAPDGSRAVAELLRARGVDVRRVDTVEAVEAGDGATTTTVLPFPEALAPSELERLAGLAGRRVVVGPDQAALDDLAVGATESAPVPVERRRPACDVAVATVAGDATLGGATYRPGAAAAVGCYAARGRATLLALPDLRTVLLGDGTALTNDALADDGNAALALGLLAQGDRVLWLLPRPGREVPAGDQRPLSELMPPGLLLAAVQLAIAAAVLALWRARRLGRVVEEPLPVVVRAAEAVEGRSRLYRAAGARASAAEALRSAVRDRTARRLALGVAPPRAALVGTAAARGGRGPGDVGALLYGAAPGDDAALVHLAEELRALETALDQEVAGP